MLGSLWFNSFSSGGGGVDAYELISTTVLANSTTSSVTFTDGGSWSNYKHLQLRIAAQSTFSSGNARGAMFLRFNGDTGANYSAHELFGDGSAAGSQNGTSLNQGWIGDFPFLQTPNSAFGAAIVDILDFASTTKYKTSRNIGGHVGTGATAHIGLVSSSWRNTAAITSITVQPISYNFVTGSRLSLYGIRGS